MKKLEIIGSIAVFIAAVYMGLTVGAHGRAIERLEREQHSVDSALFDAIKFVDSVQWKNDSILMRGFLMLNERIGNMDKTE